jgi:hypothetical protein
MQTVEVSHQLDAQARVKEPHLPISEEFGFWTMCLYRYSKYDPLAAHPVPSRNIDDAIPARHVSEYTY